VEISTQIDETLLPAKKYPQNAQAFSTTPDTVLTALRFKSAFPPLGAWPAGWKIVGGWARAALRVAVLAKKKS